jgi:glyoxylase-like metal-dependent hydrolase (beta-lactamase superfamily II)
MSRRPTFPNSAVVRAPERAVLRGGSWSTIDLAVRYGRFQHPVGGAGLIDTGYSARVAEGQRSLPLRAYAAILRPKLTADTLPVAQPHADVILLTHLHADHVSALRDYPMARIVADRAAVEHYLAASRLDGLRHGFFRELLPDDLLDRLTAVESLPLVEAPFGLGAAGDVFGDGSVLATPLPGHMRGHTGYLWTGSPRPLLYAGDAQWLRRAVMEDRPPGAPARWVLHNAALAHATARRIAAFASAGGEVVFCHDPEPAR